MTMRHALLLAAAATSTGCLRLDNFVFGSKPVDDPTTDMLAASIVLPRLREEITSIRSDDGVAVNAYLLGHEPGDGTDAKRHAIGIVYAHGQNNNLISSTPRLDLLWKMGFTVMGYDARGDGKTPGTASQSGHEADARAALKYLQQRMGADRVAFYGRSLGSLFATKASSETTTVKALVLESPVLSLSKIIEDSMSVETPTGWFIDSAMDNEAELPKFTGALLILHGDQDDYVKPEYGARLHDLATAASRNDFVSVPGADHGNVPCADLATDVADDSCPPVEGRTMGMSEVYQGSIEKFLDDVF
jgi:hypothetical protein